MEYTISQVDDLVASEIASPVLEHLGKQDTSKLYFAKKKSYDCECDIESVINVRESSPGLMGKLFSKKIADINCSSRFGDVSLRSFDSELPQEVLEKLMKHVDVRNLIFSGAVLSRGAIDSF